MRWRGAWSCWGGKEGLGLGGGAFTRAPLVSSFPRHLLPLLRLPLRGLFVYKRITSAPPSLPSLWTRPPGPYFPPPPTPNMLASQWCDLWIGWRRPSRSSYATSFPRLYKKCRTTPLSLSPSELEMQLLGAPEAAELEAEAAGEVRAM